jgi:HSP20 family protein
VVKDQISAKVEDGILTVTMPKTEPKQKVTNAIEVS